MVRRVATDPSHPHLRDKNINDGGPVYMNRPVPTKEMYKSNINILVELIENIKSDGKTIIGYGAPAKATTILNYFGLTDNEIEFTLDDNLLKHNKFIPGVKIPIKKFFFV